MAYDEEKWAKAKKENCKKEIAETVKRYQHEGRNVLISELMMLAAGMYERHGLSYFELEDIITEFFEV